MSSPASHECSKWLHQSLQTLSQRAQSLEADNGIAVDTALGPLIFDSFSGEDRQVAEQMFTSDAGSLSGSQSHLSSILPALNNLEKEWLTGRCTYADTVYGLWIAERLLSRLDARRTSLAGHTGFGLGQVLLAAAPNNRHVFGLSIVAESLRTADWHTQSLLDSNADHVVQAVQETSPDIIGLSVGYDEGLVNLDRFIAALRQNSSNPDVKIMLGGNVFSQPTEQYEWLGADFVAFSIDDALRYCSTVTSIDRPRH